MDRIRAGLTGLAAVFLVTAAASLLFAPDPAERAQAELEKPGEPLAQLGVAPSSEKPLDAAPATSDAGGEQPPGAQPSASRGPPIGPNPGVKEGPLNAPPAGSLPAPLLPGGVDRPVEI